MSRYDPARWACCSWFQASSIAVSPAAAAGLIAERIGCPWMRQGLRPTTPFPHTLTLTVLLMDRITTLGFLLALLAIWAPGGLIDCGRQAAAPITPYTSLLDR